MSALANLIEQREAERALLIDMAMRGSFAERIPPVERTLAEIVEEHQSLSDREREDGAEIDLRDSVIVLLMADHSLTKKQAEYVVGGML